MESRNVADVQALADSEHFAPKHTCLALYRLAFLCGHPPRLRLPKMQLCSAFVTGHIWHFERLTTLWAFRGFTNSTVRHQLKQSPLLQRLGQALEDRLPRCSDKSLSQMAFALSDLARLCGFRPSDQLLTALDAELLSRLDSVQPGPCLAGIAADSLWSLSCSDRPASAALQERVAAWLVGAPGAGECRRPAVDVAHALTLRQAEKLLRAWVSFAAAPGAPARKALPAVLQALDGPLAAHKNQPGAATDLLQRALTTQIRAARSVQARACASLPS